MKNQITFEQAMKRLEEIAATLETPGGDFETKPLDDTETPE